MILLTTEGEQAAEQPTCEAAPEGAAKFDFRKLFSDVAVYSSGNLLVKGMSIISAPIFTRIFDPSEYGVWSLINAVVALLTGVIMLGGDNAYTRFFFQCKSEEEKQALTATWFSFLALWSLVALAAILPFSAVLAQWIFGTQQYRAALVIGLASSPLLMMNLMLAQVLRNHFRARAFTVFNLVTALLTIGLAVFFTLYFRLGVAGALLGAATASLVIIPARLWAMRDLLRFRFAGRFIRTLLVFGLPLVPMNIAFWLFSNADRIMLARLASLDAVGLYAIAAALAAVLMLLQNAVGQSWLPHAVKVYEENRELAESIFVRTMVYFMAASGFVVTAFIALAQEVIFILVPPHYYGAYHALPFLAAGFLFFTSAHISAVTIMVKNKTVYIMVACWIVAAINIGLNILLIPPLGIIGAGAATGLSYVLYAAAYALISRRLWPIAHRRKTIAALLAVPLISILLITLIAQHGPSIGLNFLLKLVVLALCGGALYLILKYNNKNTGGWFF